MGLNAIAITGLVRGPDQCMEKDIRSEWKDTVRRRQVSEVRHSVPLRSPGVMRQSSLQIPTPSRSAKTLRRLDHGYQGLYRLYLA